MARILLAEDDDSLRRFLASALRRAGHQVEAVGDGDSALAMLDDAVVPPFDLLLADIVMPGADGIEVSRKATERAPAMKVMFITGFAAIAMNQRARRAETPTKILSKPFHLRDLVDQVDLLLAA